MHLYQQKRSELEQVASESWSVPTSELSAHEERKANLEKACREALDTALAIVGAAPTSRNAGALVQPDQGQLLLAYYEIESGWIGFAQTDSSVQSHPIGALNLEGSTPEQLSTQLLAPFKNLILEASEIVLMPWGETRKLDIHALPLDSKPLLAHSPTVYSLDLPKRTLPRASQTKTLVVSDPRGDLPVARQEGSLVSDIATTKRPTSVTHLGGNKATKAALTMRFADAEFLHYAGHGTFEGQR